MHSKLLSVVGAIALVASTAAGQVGTNLDTTNPNVAGIEKLAALPHVTPELAKTLIAKRPFAGMIQFDQLLAASLSAEQRKELYKKMFLPINLNTATRAEIMLVPGIGKRMAHEFEEYRPYKAIAQFRREMGKYVDDKEVARLEQFVFVPLDLNTAKGDDFKTIPGVGPRMIHEFEEYRPYKSMAEFRREIGKYVSAKEVARFERYLYIEGAEPEKSDEEHEAPEHDGERGKTQVDKKKRAGD